jgi:hypothetical protein
MRKPTIKSMCEQLLLDDLTAAGFTPEIGHQFYSERGWRFDFAYPSVSLAIEVDGKGRHQTDAGRISDDQKINCAIELGWKVLRYPTSRVRVHKRRARIVEQIKRILCGVSSPEDAEIVLVGD